MSELEPTTVQRILADPDFDPTKNDLIGSALVAYMKSNPARVAENDVAIKWLLRDKNVAHNFVHLVDIASAEGVDRFLRTMKRSPYRQNALETLCKKRLRGNLTDEIFEVILNNVDRHYHLHWFPSSTFKPGQHERMVKAFIDANCAFNDSLDWVSAFQTEDGIEWFADLMAHANHNSQHDFFSWTRAEFLNLVSTAAQALQLKKRTMAHERWHAIQDKILTACEKRWKERYICYHCGKGNGVDRRGRDLASNKIKSLSGYTLHRVGTDKKEGCDPQKKYPSPHEILLGHPRKFFYTCDRCGEPFTTKSGKALHQKSCWR